MSNLYIRVQTAFYTHRKTAKLRTLIGDDAFWVPPRLWAYAAENQPDGDLSGYSSEQLAMLLGCLKHGASIIASLKACSFVDEDGRIHDWGVYNGYHERYSERAKLAAATRWARARIKRDAQKADVQRESGQGTVDSGDKHCLS